MNQKKIEEMMDIRKEGGTGDEKRNNTREPTDGYTVDFIQTKKARDHEPSDLEQGWMRME